MLHQHDDLLDPGDQIHCPAHALDHLARYHPVSDVAALADLHRAQHGQVDMPAANHGKARRAVEVSGLGQFADGLLASINEVRVFFTGVRERSYTQHTVLALERDLHPGGNMVGDQRRNADAKVHVIPVAQFARGAGGHLVAAPADLYGAVGRAHLLFSMMAGAR